MSAADRGPDPSRAIRVMGIVLVALSTPAATAPAHVIAAGPAEAVLSFESIQAGPLRFELDPSGTSATIVVDTAIDAACAVVFGRDETFGRIATDTDMMGGAHRQHRVLLTDLDPDTEYVLRFQGSGVDGRLYRSETMSFRTPVATSSSSNNLAPGASIVEVSSEFSSAYAAANAIDGDLATEWSSAGDGDDAFITLDLGRSTAVGAVTFRTRAMGDGSATTRTFLVVADGRTFGPFPAGPQRVTLEATARSLRFEVDSSSGGNTGAVEIEVYPSAVQRD